MSERVRRWWGGSGREGGRKRKRESAFNGDGLFGAMALSTTLSWPSPQQYHSNPLAD